MGALGDDELLGQVVFFRVRSERMNPWYVFYAMRITSLSGSWTSNARRGHAGGCLGPFVSIPFDWRANMSCKGASALQNLRSTFLVEEGLSHWYKRSFSLFYIIRRPLNRYHTMGHPLSRPPRVPWSQRRLLSSDRAALHTE